MSYRYNTGMSSNNEMFAMKKNLAYEAKFEHKLSAMTRDFFHKRENFKQDIRNVYADLKNVRMSTGYSLDTVRSGGKQRKPNAPTIYLPPIGIRLMKKYVGLDFKRMSLSGAAEEQRRLSSALISTINLTKPVLPSMTVDNDVSRRFDRLMTNKKLPSTEANSGVAVADVNEKPDILKINTYAPMESTEVNEITKSHEAVKVIEDSENSEQNTKEETRTLSGNRDLETSDEATNLIINVSAGVQEDMANENDDSDNPVDNTQDAVLEGKVEKIELDTSYNLEERRSSRSTFRTRNSARLQSQKSVLSEYNMKVIGLSSGENKRGSKSRKTKKGKEKIGNFYLDYGDGKLHDTMQIPKMKDCARTWCNPHCKTCKMRTTGKPCFILVPVDDIGRRRKIPADKRLSMFRSFGKVGSSVEAQDKVNEQKENKKANKDEIDKVSDKSGIKVDESTEKAEVEVDENGIQTDEETDDAANKSDVDTGESLNDRNKITRFLQERRQSRNKEKRYSKKRLEELSQPRGGPPAEVRFSKMTLRREQEQLIESERTKAFSKYEKDNLTFIQGKISLFLALLNQQEMTEKPLDMVHLPIRENLTTNRTEMRKLRIRSKKLKGRRVNFSPNTRFRLFS